jgi:mRNA-degrading endonuclease RelE of RelBE toxin-antitoxin system
MSPDAVRQFKALKSAERSRLKKAMQTSLGDDDATIPSTNRFPLRRPSGFGVFEFRDGDLRVFYRVDQDEVRITAIGRKRGNMLFIDGRRVIS